MASEVAGRSDETTISDVLRILYRRKGLVAFVFLLTMMAVTVFTLRQTPIFESEALLLIKFGREFIYLPEVGDRDAFVSRDETIINAELQILRSGSVLEGVVRAIGPETLYPELFAEPKDDGSFLQAAMARLSGNSNPVQSQPKPLESAAVAKLGGNLSAQALREANVIRVAVRHPDPEMAAKAVNLVVDLFKEEHLRVFSESQSVQFLRQKVEEYRQQLEQSEAEIQEFQSAYRIFSAESPTELHIRHQNEVSAELRKTESEIAGIREKLAFLEQQRLSTSAYGAGDRAEKLDLDIVSARSQLRFQQARRGRLQQQVREAERQLWALPKQMAEYRDLARNRDANEKNYERYVKKLEEAVISEEMDRQKIANISVIQAGLVPSEPVVPRTRLNLAVGMALGVAMSAGFAFAAESLSPKSA